MYSLDMINPESLKNVKEIELKMEAGVKWCFAPTGVVFLIQRREDSEGVKDLRGKSILLNMVRCLGLSARWII